MSLNHLLDDEDLSLAILDVHNFLVQGAIRGKLDSSKKTVVAFYYRRNPHLLKMLDHIIRNSEDEIRNFMLLPVANDLLKAAVEGDCLGLNYLLLTGGIRPSVAFNKIIYSRNPRSLRWFLSSGWMPTIDEKTAAEIIVYQHPAHDIVKILRENCPRWDVISPLVRKSCSDVGWEEFLTYC